MNGEAINNSLERLQRFINRVLECQKDEIYGYQQVQYSEHNINGKTPGYSASNKIHILIWDHPMEIKCRIKKAGAVILKMKSLLYSNLTP